MIDDDLLDEILANPRFTSLRLVYADRLIERGDPRGELIQLACARGPRSKERLERHAELVAQLAAEWRRDRDLEVVVERGFIRKVRGSADAVVAHAGAIAREPIDEIQCRPGVMRSFAALSLLSRVETLVVDRALDEDVALALAESPHLGALRALRIILGPLRREVAQAVGRAPWAAQLRHLVVYGTGRTAPVDAIVEQGGPTTIALMSCAMAATAGTIVERLPRLQSCTLRFNAIGPADTRALAAVRLDRLTNLALCYESPGELGARALSESTNFPALRRLSLDGNEIGDAGIEAVVRSPLCANLVELGLSVNTLTDRGFRAIATSPQLARLRFLDIRYNRNGLDGVQAIAHGLPALERLRIAHHTEEARALFAHRPALRLL